ncbi:acylphosphatase [Patescibacteria group bacterium]|nr:acylphosphatase [Patescibacteria group bacterium]
MNQLIRAHIFVRGRVQGVFFRKNTCQKAKEKGITGWVRNLDDGRVEAIFEGEKEKVEEILEWAGKGPVWAKVDDLEVDWQESKNEFASFEIIY